LLQWTNSHPSGGIMENIYFLCLSSMAHNRPWKSLISSLMPVSACSSFESVCRYRGIVEPRIVSRTTTSSTIGCHCTFGVLSIVPLKRPCERYTLKSRLTFSLTWQKFRCCYSVGKTFIAWMLIRFLAARVLIASFTRLRSKSA